MSQTREHPRVRSPRTRLHGRNTRNLSPSFTLHYTTHANSHPLDLGNSLGDAAVPQSSGTGEGNPVQREAAIAVVPPPEVNQEDVKPAEVTTSAQQETKTTEEVTSSNQDVPVTPAPVEQEATSTVEPEINSAPAQNGDSWQQRENELLKTIQDLETVQGAADAGPDKVALTLKARENEIELLRARVLNLETELQAALCKPGGGKNQEMIDNIKQQHEDLLSKARGMIFDKTKMVKNQELQIEALTTQVQSLKDINAITKDLLDIRNQEVKAMEDRFEVMDLKYKAERERHQLVLQRAETSTGLNDDLKKEYETQLGLFKNLREKYDQRVQALTAENERLKEQLNGSTT